MMKELLKNRTFRKTFLSYTLILGIPIIIFSILFMYTMIQEEQKKIYESYTMDANRIRRTVDDKIMELKDIGDRLSNKTWVRKSLINTDIYKEEFDLFKKQEMKQELQHAIGESGILSFGVIIYPEQKKLLSPWGEYTTEEFFSTVSVFDPSIKELVDQSTKEYHILNILSPTTISLWGNKRQVIPVIQSLEIANQPRAVLLLFIDPFYLSSFIHRMAGSSLSYFKIVDEVETNIYTQNNSVKESQDFEKLLAFNLDSEVCQWQYFIYYPNTILTLHFPKIVSTLVSILLSMFAGIIVAFLFAKVSYKPLDALLKKITNTLQYKPVEKQKESLWEYRWIEEFFDHLVIKNQNLQEAMDGYKKAAKSNMLLRLLKGYFQGDGLTQRLQELDILYTDEMYYSILLIHFSFLEEKQERSLDERKREFMILMILEQVMSQPHIQYQLVEVTTTDMIFILSSNQSFDEEGTFPIKDIKDQLEKHMGVIPDIIQGPVEKGLLGISKSYYGANEELQYILFHKKNMVYTQETYHSDFYYYPTDWEVQLINNLKTGNIDTLTRILDEIKQENEKRNLSHEGMTNLLTIIMETILRVIKELKIDGRIYIKQFTSKIEIGNIEELWAYIYEVGSLICERVQYSNAPSTVEVGNQILLYINNHYASPEMSLKKLSEVFNMSVSKVSKLFKEVTGINFYDYICRLRIEKAKELLREESFELSTIAQQVGYEHVYSFRRAFTRYEGIKPDEYALQFSSNLNTK